jgi:hypothetical protein
MASQWLYKVMGEQVGPVSVSELRNLAQHGTISSDTLVRQSPDGVWVLAERLRGLFSDSDARTPSKAITSDEPPPPKTVMSSRAANVTSDPTPPEDPTIAHLVKIEKLLAAIVERSQRPKEYQAVIIDTTFGVQQLDPKTIALRLNGQARNGWSVKGMAAWEPPSLTGDARAIIVVMER